MGTRRSIKARFVDCTLKRSPETSNTEALATVVAEGLTAEGTEVEWVGAADHDLRPGVNTDEGDGDEWPALHGKLLESEILVIATPTWLGRPRASRSGCWSEWTR